MSDIFDKIIDGEIPSYKLFENKSVLAILDISQVSKGHTLLIAKKELKDIFDYSTEDAQSILKWLPVISKAIQQSDSSIKGINIISNNGEEAGQTVLHSHWHLIPRRENDNINVFPQVDNSKQFQEKDYQEIAESIRTNIQ